MRTKRTDLNEKKKKYLTVRDLITLMQVSRVTVDELECFHRKSNMKNLYLNKAHINTGFLLKAKLSQVFSDGLQVQSSYILPGWHTY